MTVRRARSMIPQDCGGGSDAHAQSAAARQPVDRSCKRPDVCEVLTLHGWLEARRLVVGSLAAALMSESSCESRSPVWRRANARRLLSRFNRKGTP